MPVVPVSKTALDTLSARMRRPFAPQAHLLSERVDGLVLSPDRFAQVFDEAAEVGAA